MRVVHFETPADDTARCIPSCEKTFGWQFEKWEGPMPYGMIEISPDLLVSCREAAYD